MYKCNDCDEIFEYPEYVEFCYEDEYGVSSIFGTRNYGTYQVCPFCGGEDFDMCNEDEEDF